MLPRLRLLALVNAQTPGSVTISSISCGPDPEPFVAALQHYAEAGFDEIFVNQIGDDVTGFLRFFTKEVRPRLDL